MFLQMRTSSCVPLRYITDEAKVMILFIAFLFSAALLSSAKNGLVLCVMLILDAGQNATGKPRMYIEAKRRTNKGCSVKEALLSCFSSKHGQVCCKGCQINVKVIIMPCPNICCRKSCGGGNEYVQTTPNNL